MKKHSILLSGVFVALFGIAGVALATPVFFNTAVVSNVTHSATFDDIDNFDPLANYIEDGIVVSTDDDAWAGPFDAFNTGSNSENFYYGYWGGHTWVTISMYDGSIINSLDFLLGDGYSGFSTTNLIWETSLNGSVTGFGDVVIDKGTSVGWVDQSGFDSIRLAASYYGLSYFGAQKQAIAIDNLRINSPYKSVPEPTTLLLLGTGCIWVIRRQSQKV